MNDDMRNLQRSFNETVRGRNINLNINEDSILNKFEFPLNSTDDLEQLLNNYLLIESNFKSTVRIILILADVTIPDNSNHRVFIYIFCKKQIPDLSLKC